MKVLTIALATVFVASSSAAWAHRDGALRAPLTMSATANDNGKSTAGKQAETNMQTQSGKEHNRPVTRNRHNAYPDYLNRQ